MTVIELQTYITAPAEVCFDLSRSVDLHKISMGNSNEMAISGTVTGLIHYNGTVTWQARHFGFNQRLRSRITIFERPSHFRDVMEQGAFKSLEHDHLFECYEEGTIMKDIFRYEVPFGKAGKIFNRFFLKPYLVKLLTQRNQTIKRIAESGDIEKYLGTVNNFC